MGLMVLELTYETYFMISRSFLCDSLSSLQRFADQLASQPLIEEANIQLNGELGSGKSTFTRFLLQSLGVKGTIKSPTYAVMEEYLVHTPSKDIHILTEF
jgi:tRNA threonylcarbamoyl adenosine modification protein YjeE